MKTVLQILVRMGIGLGLITMGLGLFGLMVYYPIPFFVIGILVAGYFIGASIDNED